MEKEEECGGFGLISKVKLKVDVSAKVEVIRSWYSEH
jgi:hypothetical protein